MFNWIKKFFKEPRKLTIPAPVDLSVSHSLIVEKVLEDLDEKNYHKVSTGKGKCLYVVILEKYKLSFWYENLNRFDIDDICINCTFDEMKKIKQKIYRLQEINRENERTKENLKKNTKLRKIFPNCFN